MKKVLLISIIFLINACSPRYEIKTHYTLPSNLNGKQCVRTCSNERKVCQAHCNQKQDQCLATAKQSAKDAFPSLMNEYQGVLDQYHYAMDRYNLEMETWQREERRVHQDFEHYRERCHQSNKNNYECQRAHELDSQLHSLEDHEPMAPERPIKPSLSSEIQESQRNCSNSCGCDKEYDSCFVSCGGSLRYERFCVENCKEKK